MRIYLPVMVIALAVFGSEAQAAAIVDASFESPNVSPASYVYNPGVSGATFSGYSGVAANGSFWNFAPAPDGTQVAFLQGYNGGNGSFSVGVTGLVAGTQYVLSFLAAQRPNYATDPFTVSFNGIQIGSYSVSSAAFSLFTSAAFIPANSSGTLTFTGTATQSDSGVGIDELTLSVPSAVPEPKAWAMMLLGFAAIGMSLRPRKARLLQVA